MLYFMEATREIGKLGAQSIIDWVKTNHDNVELAVTRAFIAYQAAHDIDPAFRMTNLGEQAAVLRRIQVNRPDKIVEVTTANINICRWASLQNHRRAMFGVSLVRKN